MTRRSFMRFLIPAIAMIAVLKANLAAFAEVVTAQIVKTDDEWRKILTPEQYNILREEGTERPFTSPLNNEKREGVFVCTACDQKLFPSEYKFDSGTGWPSFFNVIPGSIGTKEDRKFYVLRTEYHCSRCGGHHGHVFDDGPKPTGLRYCNNGIALKFIPKA